MVTIFSISNHYINSKIIYCQNIISGARNWSEKKAPLKKLLNKKFQKEKLSFCHNLNCTLETCTLSYLVKGHLRVKQCFADKNEHENMCDIYFVLQLIHVHITANFLLKSKRNTESCRGEKSKGKENES